MARVIAETKSPAGCADAEIAAFCCYVRQGGEVESAGLEDRVRDARALVFVYVDRALVGVAALKRPSATHRDGKFSAAGVSAIKSRYGLELGWVFVPPEHRGKGYSHTLVTAAMSPADNAPVFATTRADNAAMHRGLERTGFVRAGKSWKSKRGEYELVLYVAPPPPNNEYLDSSGQVKKRVRSR